MRHPSSLALPEVLSFYFGGMSDNMILAMPCNTHGICSVLQGTKWYCKEFCQGNIRTDPRVIARAVKRALQLIHGPPPRSRISFLMCLMSISNFQALRTQPRGVWTITHWVLAVDLERSTSMVLSMWVYQFAYPKNCWSITDLYCSCRKRRS